jgi:hypothetical protein
MYRKKFLLYLQVDNDFERDDHKPWMKYWLDDKVIL